MKEKRDEEGVEKVQGIDVIDLGDAVVETKQVGFPVIYDSCCTFTFSGK